MLPSQTPAHSLPPQILKAFTPALTLLLCVLSGLEQPQWPLLLSVLLIAMGTTSAILVCRQRCTACKAWQF